jgi:hypothetical protein
VNGCQQIIVTASAQNDLEQAYWFYEVQQSGLGEYFLSSLQSDIDALRLYAGVHAKPFRWPLHRSLSKNFPFAVFYTCQEQTARVVAVLDCRSSPRSIHQRLKNMSSPP